MSDGYARGFQGCPAIVRMDNQTAFAYFRLIEQETGFDVRHNRVTKEVFDTVDWKKLGLPNFGVVGRMVRDRLPEKDTAPKG